MRSATYFNRASPLHEHNILQPSITKMKDGYLLPLIRFILSFYIKAQPLQGLGGGAHIQTPLQGPITAVHHRIDLLELIRGLQRKQDRTSF